AAPCTQPLPSGRDPAAGPPLAVTGPAGARTLTRLVAQGRARAAEELCRPPLGDLIRLLEVVGAGPLLAGRHHLFFATSWSILFPRRSSAPGSLGRPTSASSCLTRRASSALAALKRNRQRW